MTNKISINTPWRAEVCEDRGPIVVDQSGVMIGICGTWSYKDNRAQAEARFAGNVANTRRIAASVNALQHVSIEQLESGEIFSLAQRLADAERERDKLLEFVPLLLEQIGQPVSQDNKELRDRAAAAIFNAQTTGPTIAQLQDAGHLPKAELYTSVSKGGSYTKLGAIRGAGSLKGLAGIAYQNDKGDLFIREPECFAKRMVLAGGEA